MTTHPLDLPIVRSVLHPTDFSDASHTAFAYALAVALLRQTRLTLLHTGPPSARAGDWTKFPGVRETLERWQVLEPNSPRSAVYNELAVRVKKVEISDPDPVSGIVNFLADEPHDMMVLATEGRSGLPRWLDRSVAETAAARSKTMTLFVPADGRGFIEPATGHLGLHRILVPVENGVNPAAAIEFATRAAEIMRSDESHIVDVTVFHVGPGSDLAAISYPDVSFCRFATKCVEGDVVNEIAAVANKGEAELVVMTTQGRRGVLDAVLGSTTQRVLREAGCPVLAVPAP